ncbi:MAG: hypothetical protein H7Y19_04395 [Luteimonas sp.]|nr:hypothetical protein [Luteimonas sp.]
MAIEAALIKPVVDALLGLFRQGENLHLKRNAETALREAIRELLLANPNESKAEARIAIAKAAGIISEDVVLAEKMLSSHRANEARTRGKGGGGKPRKAASADKDGEPATADKTPAKKAAKAKPAPKKPAKKA